MMITVNLYGIEVVSCRFPRCPIRYCVLGKFRYHDTHGVSRMGFAYLWHDGTWRAAAKYSARKQFSEGWYHALKEAEVVLGQASRQATLDWRAL